MELINQLLDLSRLEANAMPVQVSLGNVSDCVAEIVQAFQGESERAGITLRYQSALPGDYFFDRARLDRIVSNLVANAVKCSRPQEGTGIGLALVKELVDLTRFYSILSHHLDESEFGVNELSREIGMSRASLYRKLEAVV